MSFLGRFNSSAASPGGSSSKTRPPVRTSSRSAETTGAGGRASLAPSSGLAADLIQPIKFSASPFLPPSPNLVSDPAQFSPDFSSSFDPTFTTVRTPGSSTGLLDAGGSPWVDVKSENPGSEGRPKISGSRGVKERAREEDKLLGKAKLGVEKVTVLIRETSEVIREQGSSLPPSRPHLSADRRKVSLRWGYCVRTAPLNLLPSSGDSASLSSTTRSRPLPSPWWPPPARMAMQWLMRCHGSCGESAGPSWTSFGTRSDTRAW